MSTPVLILGEPGSGKTASLRNFDPATTLLIQTIRKPLSFKKPGWVPVSRTAPKGNIIVSDNTETIIAAMTKTSRKIIVLDDWNLTMTNEFMRRSAETGYQKFSDIGRSAWDLMTAAQNLPADVRVYFLGHVSTDEFGNIKAKTIGRLVDDKCPVESLFSIVLRCRRHNGEYIFDVQSDGITPCKSPIGLFDDDLFENDLMKVDRRICEYYDLTRLPAAA